MRPIKLILSAFGPYGDRMPEIRFDQFEEKGIFLICGDTGAGKTTIFDAICFALYGETSGAFKDVHNLRSEYADPSTESFVDFHFTHQGKPYHVLRSPSWVRPKLRGTGTIAVPEKATLYPGDQPPVSGTNPVNAYIRDLLGVSYDQFKQIAMIAQGEFWNLLNVKTSDRAAILRNIFLTGGYNSIVDVLKRRQDEGVEKRNSTERDILLYFQDVTAPPDSPRAPELSQMQADARGSGSAWNLEAMLELIDALTGEDDLRRQQLEQDLSRERTLLEEKKKVLALAETDNRAISSFRELTGQKEALAAQSGAFAAREDTLKRRRDATYNVKPSHDAWQAQTAKVRQTQQTIRTTRQQWELARQRDQQAKEALAAAQARLPEAEEQKTLAVQISGDLTRYAQREELIRDIATLEKAAGLFAGREAGLEQREQALQAKLDTLSERIRSLENSPVDLETTKLQLKTLEDRKKRMDQLLLKDFPALERSRRELERRQQAFSRAQDAYIAARDRRQRAEDHLENCRAGLLALNLEEGVPCPVCGALHHPAPASLPDSVTTEEQCRKAKQEEEDARKLKESALREAETRQQSVKDGEAHLRSSVTDCLEEQLPADLPLSEVKARLLQRRADTESTIQEHCRRVKALEQACENLDAARKAQEKAAGPETRKLASDRDALKEEKHRNETGLAQKRAALEPLQALPFASQQAAQERLTQVRQQIRTIQEANQSAEEASTKASRQLAGLSASLETLDGQLTQTREEEERLHGKFLALLDTYHFADEAAFLAHVSNDRAIRREDQEISAYHTSVATVEAQWASARKNAEGKTPVDLKAVQEEVGHQDRTVTALQEQSMALIQRCRSNRDRKEKIAALQAPLERYRREADMATRLYQLVRGTTGNGKITLEQYIQAAGFDGIIQAANRRLLPMSDGQFELCRKENSLTRLSGSFLDLEVLDHFTGRRRPVGNLSGGESFKASMSLALGLSDTVSSQMGGIQMEALFIDEGFGTLDRRSIENAMDILVNLSGSGKLVGVISHREELKDAIPQQIRVQKTKNGSRISVDTGL